MKLLFYSGGQQRENKELHQELMALTGKRRGISFTYVPFCEDQAEIFYRRAIRRYQRFGASKFHCLTVDAPSGIRADDLEKALQSDVIYLAGGNTFYFLSWLRKRGMLGALRRYAKEGGVLAGLSAGAHILTPRISLAGLKGLDPDENEVKLMNLNALGLVSFEFMPHFPISSRAVKILKGYSAKNQSTVYACADGGGIVINGDQFSIYGRSWVFHGADWLRLS